MGGKEGTRGYLVQTVIALLESLEDSSWLSVVLEPDHADATIDIVFEYGNSRKAIQVKSSINQIGKSDAERWAQALTTAKSATDFELVLVGPCSQSVAKMGTCGDVVIPCPKNLDFNALLGHAAHLLDKLLTKEGLARRTPEQRELIVEALLTELSVRAVAVGPLSRVELLAQLKLWGKVFSATASLSWERVDFTPQRTMASAIAGQRLGPMDVDACPRFTICDEILLELNRTHLYELVGTSGCGKSITAWHVAHKLFEKGFSVWRPRATSEPEHLLSDLPQSTPQLLVLDDAQIFGQRFANRLAESSNANSKVLLVSTVENPLLSNRHCVSPEKFVEELKQVVLARKTELLPLVHAHDNRVTDKYFDTSFEHRVADSARQKSPWEFFWVLRGGWQTASREFDSLKQFSGATCAVVAIAIGQIATCDAGVSYDWILSKTAAYGMTGEALNTALRTLDSLGLITITEVIRTKHLRYASRLIEESLCEWNSSLWPSTSAILIRTIIGDRPPLKGICWLFSVFTFTDAFRKTAATEFQEIVAPVIERCHQETEDIDWASGCFFRLTVAFNLPPQQVLALKAVILRWFTFGYGPTAYFCAQILYHLTSRSRRGSDDFAKPLVEEVDVARLVEIVNSSTPGEFYNLGRLLGSLANCSPSWGATFIDRLDWPRLRTVILGSSTENCFEVDCLIASLVQLAERSGKDDSLNYIKEITPYLVKAINDAPCDTESSVHDIFSICLGYSPKFLRPPDCPDESQSALAATIVDQVSPEAFANAINCSTARCLEIIARFLSVVAEIKPEIVTRIASMVSEGAFFDATADEWRTQSIELGHFLCVFCNPSTFEPARSWVRNNQQCIEGPLTALYTALAPDVAITFYDAGKGVVLARKKNANWTHVRIAIINLLKQNQQKCLAIIEDNLSELKSAFICLSLEPIQDFVPLLRLLYLVSPRLLDEFVDAIDLDDPDAVATINQLVSSQPLQKVAYERLAHFGLRAGGKVSQLATTFLERLEKVDAHKTRAI